MKIIKNIKEENFNIYQNLKLILQGHLVSQITGTPVEPESISSR